MSYLRSNDRRAALQFRREPREWDRDGMDGIGREGGAGL